MFVYVCTTFFSFGLGVLAGISLNAWQQKKLFAVMFQKPSEKMAT